MLRVSQARKIFYAGAPDERKALDGADLSLETGEFCVVIGSNGAGKSSLLNAISGRMPLDEGRIEINGADLTDLPVFKRAARIASVFQDPMIGTAPTMTVAENMLLAELRGRRSSLSPGLNAERRDLFRERLSVIGLGLEDRLDTNVGLLSGGQRQSLSLVMAVSNEPDLLLLDEHTAALDPRTADLVMKATISAIDTHDLTALMVTHNMKHAVDYGDSLIMMDSGRVRLSMSGEEKAAATVETLIERFHETPDWLMLQEA